MKNINSFITKIESKSNKKGALEGCTIAIKDNISTKGIRTTCGSAMLKDYVPPYDATVVAKIKAAGATIVGKTNMDEFGMGTTTETSYFGPTVNPHDESRVAGGSSGGSAAAVASGEAMFGLGTDTGGSIRCPAAFCGVVGIKPTYGLVSRYGLVAYANSLEQIGPIARTVEGAAKLLDVIAGEDVRDSTSSSDGRDTKYADCADGEIEGMTVGIPVELVNGIDKNVLDPFELSMSRLEERGGIIKEITIPSLEKAVAAYYVIAMSEASSNLARYDGVRYGISGGFGGDWNQMFSASRENGFGKEVKRRILLGTYALSAGYQDRYYAKAQRVKAWVRKEFENAFKGVDVVASPTMPVLPFKLGEGEKDPLKMYLSDSNTVPVNLAGLPAITVPAEWDKREGPVGIQFVGARFQEEKLIRAGSAVER